MRYDDGVEFPNLHQVIKGWRIHGVKDERGKRREEKWKFEKIGL
jgi:hypothetical protein